MRIIEGHKFHLLAVFSALLLSALFSPGVMLEANAEDQLWVEGSEEENLLPEIKLPSFAPAIEKLGESVVNIRTEGKEEEEQEGPGGPGGYHGAPQGSPFEFLFQMPEQRNRNFSSLGSGFVIHPDGYIVTNLHVIEQASEILVSFRDDKRTYKAKLVGSDSKTDLALIKVDREEKLKAAPLGNSDQLLPGDWVIAIGNPFRLGHTATVGIVSAKSRRIPGGKPYDSFIQTDASINPGNSGGPLFDSKGRVVGVNTAIFSPGRYGSAGFNIGIGFAIPINQVKGIISQIKDKGKVTRGWLGVLIQGVSPEIAEAMKLKEARGALVADVVPKSPAEEAGFKRGDVILTYDGKPVEENDDLPQLVAQTEVGSRVNVDLIREGRSKTLKVKISELKDEEGEEPLIPEEGPTADKKLGLTVQGVSPDIARSLGVEDTSGVVITDVAPDGPAAKAGLRRGDIVLEVSSKSVRTPDEFRNLTKGLKKDAPVLLLVRRSGNTIFLTLKVD